MSTPLCLWRLDEASSGTGPTSAADLVTSPVNLTITYGASAAWTSVGAGNGLDSGTHVGNDANGSRLRSAALNGTKIDTSLNSAKILTWEIVISVPNAGVQAGGTYVDITEDTIATNFGGLYKANLADTWEFWFPGNANAGFTVAPPAANTVTVVHWVVDTSQATAANRLKVYFNGVAQTVTVGDGVAQNTTLTIDSTKHVLMLNNNDTPPWCTTSKLYYAALYASALTTGEISANAARLAANNDTDPNLVLPQTKRVTDTQIDETPQHARPVPPAPAAPAADQPPRKARPRAFEEPPPDVPPRNLEIAAIPSGVPPPYIPLSRERVAPESLTLDTPARLLRRFPEITTASPPPLVRERTSPPDGFAEEPPPKLRFTAIQALLPIDAPPLGTWMLAEEPRSEEIPPRQMRRAPESVDAPPRVLRRALNEDFTAELPIRRAAAFPSSVDTIPPARRGAAASDTIEERVARRMLAAPIMAQVTAVDSPPTRGRPRAYEEPAPEPCPTRRGAVPLPSGAVAAFTFSRPRPRPLDESSPEESSRRVRGYIESVDAPPTRARARAPEETAPESLPQKMRRAPESVDAPTLTRRVHVDDAQSEERPQRMRGYLEGASAPLFARRGRVDESSTDERPQRARGYFESVDAPPLARRARTEERAIAERVARRGFVLPPVVVAGDTPIFARRGHVSLDESAAWWVAEQLARRSAAELWQRTALAGKPNALVIPLETRASASVVPLETRTSALVVPLETRASAVVVA